MWKKRILALIILLLAASVGLFVYKSTPSLNKNFENQSVFFQKHYFRLGLDLSGGSHLVYKADVSGITSGISEAMDALRDVIERRVNLFGVSEPVVQVQGGGFVSGGVYQLIVDLPGVTDLDRAIEMIGQTPLLEFKVEGPANAPREIKVGPDGKIDLGQVDIGPQFVSTELTGRYLKRASLQFAPNTQEPQVALQFDDTGSDLFAKITKENAGKVVAIYLDGAPISIPRVGEEYKDTGITGGQAFISGNFTPQEAKILVGRLNSGALPVPITLLSKQTIGATLGESAVRSGIKAAIIGFLLVALFLILWYRLPGLIAVISLSIFVVIMLAIFKLLPVTLTAAGIAGFVISMGIAVDANVLIFERIKEELRGGRTIADAISSGFSRAWLAIRDSNTSTIIGSVILFWLGTPLIKGFALVLGTGVLVSLLSAIVVTRIFLLAVNFFGEGKAARFLFNSGATKT